MVVLFLLWAIMLMQVSGCTGSRGLGSEPLNLKGVDMHIIRNSLTLGIFTTVALGGARAEDLVYVAVDPCRIADTRNASEGYIRANTNRDFRIAGTSGELAEQGGQVGCQNPKRSTDPVAVAAYILAVPTESSTGNGVLSAYPSNLPPPPTGSGSTVNFAEGQIIGNTTIVRVCSETRCPAGGELAVLARNTDQHVVIDVQGYFFPIDDSGREVVESTITPNVANGTVLSETLSCPNDKVAVSGGYTLTSQESFIYSILSSAPTGDPQDWRFTYRVSYDPDKGPVPINLYAICSYE
jgi:hypothetical protein